MPNAAVEPSPPTAQALRRLAARRDRHEQALDDVRSELGRVIRMAVEQEGATPQALARLTGLTRPYIYTILKGGTNG